MFAIHESLAADGSVFGATESKERRYYRGRNDLAITGIDWNTGAQIPVDQPDWAVAPGNINLEHFASECPVDKFEFQDTGFYDVIGNVWQWTESPIDALPGFEVHPLYDDFSAPTFDGKHTLFKGGSWISVGCNGATVELDEGSAAVLRHPALCSVGSRNAWQSEAVPISPNVS